MLRPIPPLPPVTIATRPFRSNSAGMFIEFSPCRASERDLYRWAEIGAAQKRRCGGRTATAATRDCSGLWGVQQPAEWLTFRQTRLGTSDHAIPSFSFGLEHSLVGHCEKLPLIASILRKSGQSGADGHLHILAVTRPGQFERRARHQL